MSGRRDLRTFARIRVGSMVPSNTANDPARIASAAAKFGVATRGAVIAERAVEFGDAPEYWCRVLAALGHPPTLRAEWEWLPVASRLSGLGSARVETAARESNPPGCG